MNKKYNITDRLEKLGWLKTCTAKEQFLNTPSLLFQYKTYDDYLESHYNHQRMKWVDRVAANTSEDNKAARTDFESNSNNEVTQKQADTNYTTFKEVTKYPIDMSTSYKDDFVVKQDVYSLKKFKNKVNKYSKNNRVQSSNCPYCLSKLVTNNFGILECSGEKLRIWIEEFLRYDKLDELQRKTYLKLYSNPSMFLDLYERWSWKDETGKRQEFTCIYSNKIGNPIGRFRTYLADPAVVYHVERSLGRKLTEEEKKGEVDLWREGNRFFEDYKEGRFKIKIPQLIFPDSFI